MCNLWLYFKFGIKVISVVPVIVNGVISLWDQVQRSLQDNGS